MQNMKCDVLVVGAGPGGSLTAQHAAKNGMKTLLIEKRQEIGSPVRCGEGIAKQWIPDIGLQPDRRWIANEVKGARIFSPAGHALTLSASRAGNEVGYVIERDVFDKELAKAAVRAGADLMVKTAATGVIRENGKIAGVKAEHFGDPFEIRADIVIGADGFESQVGRWAGIDTSLKAKDVNVCFEYTSVGLDVNPDYNDFYIGSCSPGGYIWVFTKGPDSANIGIGVQLARLGTRERGGAKRLLDTWLKKQPHLAKGRPTEQIAGAVSVCAPIERTVADGIMLVGDAARQIDPLTGGGVSNACIAGRIAGEVAAEAVKAGDTSAKFLQKYERGWRARMEEHLYRNWMAKEKLCKLSDDVFDKVILTLKEADLQIINTLEILRLVQSKHPELVKEFEDLL